MCLINVLLSKSFRVTGSLASFPLYSGIFGGWAGLEDRWRDQLRVGIMEKSQCVLGPFNLTRVKLPTDRRSGKQAGKIPLVWECQIKYFD